RLHFAQILATPYYLPCAQTRADAQLNGGGRAKLTGAAAQTRDLDAEIDCLLNQQAERTPFLHPTWLRSWFDEFGADREPVFLRVGEDEPLAIAPLMREDERLTFMGDSSVCDFMDILVAPDRQSEA